MSLHTRSCSCQECLEKRVEFLEQALRQSIKVGNLVLEEWAPNTFRVVRQPEQGDSFSILELIRYIQQEEEQNNTLIVRAKPIEKAPKNRQIMLYLPPTEDEPGCWVPGQWNDACNIFVWTLTPDNKVRRENFFDVPTHWAEIKDLTIIE